MVGNGLHQDTDAQHDAAVQDTAAHGDVAVVMVSGQSVHQEVASSLLVEDVHTGAATLGAPDGSDHAGQVSADVAGSFSAAQTLIGVSQQASETMERVVKLPKSTPGTGFLRRKFAPEPCTACNVASCFAEMSRPGLAVDRESQTTRRVFAAPALFAGCEGTTSAHVHGERQATTTTAPGATSRRAWRRASSKAWRGRRRTTSCSRRSRSARGSCRTPRPVCTGARATS